VVKMTAANLSTRESMARSPRGLDTVVRRQGGLHKGGI
jgi:hypothetical protein